jgi:hypothetical protein
MPQQSWTYLNKIGQQFDIGLYHGLKSGHVIVYCNKSIVLIDFTIKETKKYSFFIGEEFLELDLEKNEKLNQKFEYSLKINHDFLTPYNRILKKINKKNNIIAACLGFAFFSVIGITCYFIFSR